MAFPIKRLLLTGAALIVLALLSHQILTGPQVQVSDLTLNANGLRLYRGRAFTGTAVSYYPSGHLKTSEQFLAGRRHGWLREWFPNGVLGYEAFFDRGQRHGSMKSWWLNGNPRSSTHYQHNVINGESLHWYRSGEKFKRLNYVDGKPQGLQQGWRLNGKLFSNYEYRNGRIYGLNNANLCVELSNEEIAQLTKFN